MVVLDTNIIIDHLRQDDGVNTNLKKVYKNVGKDYLALSIISVQELYEGRSTRSKRKLAELLAIISPLKVISYDLEIARLAGIIARDLPITIEFADSAIAASCIHNQYSLFTLNKKHFKDIKKLELYKV